MDHLLDLRKAKRKSAALRWWSDDEREKWEWYKEYEPPLVKTVRRLTRRDYQAWLEDEQVKVEEAAAQGRLKPLWGLVRKLKGGKVRKGIVNFGTSLGREVSTQEEEAEEWRPFISGRVWGHRSHDRCREQCC